MKMVMMFPDGKWMYDIDTKEKLYRIEDKKWSDVPVVDTGYVEKGIIRTDNTIIFGDTKDDGFDTAKDDKISISGNNLTVSSGKGNDKIWDYSNGDSVIFCGEGNDYFKGNSEKGTATIVCGKGDDSLEFYSNYSDEKYYILYYAEGDGNDSIHSDSHTKITLNIAGSYSTVRDYYDMYTLVEVGDSTISVGAGESQIKINSIAKSSIPKEPAEPTAATESIETKDNSEGQTILIPDDYTNKDDSKSTSSSSTTKTDSAGKSASSSSTTKTDSAGKSASSSSTTKTTASTASNLHTYSGGNKSITNYSAGQKINFNANFTGLGFNATDFMLNSSSGSLTIKNVRDKVIDVAVNNNTVAYAYLASGEGEINGSGISQLEVIIGGNNSANQITAGSGGSSLWGGAGGNDILTGGAGQDTFFFGKSDGKDVINNASSGDVVNLYDVSLSDIVSANISGNQISVGFNTGSDLQINSSENLSAKFNLSDGSWKFNHSTNSWQNA